MLLIKGLAQITPANEMLRRRTPVFVKYIVMRFLSRNPV